MVLYLSESVINEGITASQIRDAITKREAVRIHYSGEDNPHHGLRYIEPYVYGLTKSGNPAFRAYQYWGDTKKGTPKWKLFRLDRVDAWEPTGEQFDLEPKARGWAAEAYNNNGDGSMSTVFQAVQLNQEPLTDYERLKARTQRIKTRKPFNINQVTNTKKENGVSTKPSGPIQTIDTDNASENNNTSSPITIDKAQASPVNNKGEQTQNNPTSQNNQVQGPITKNSPENAPMDSDEFKKMISRNLDITKKEKEKRGVDNFGNKEI